jgi:creatinine amidohydrolase
VSAQEPGLPRSHLLEHLYWPEVKAAIESNTVVILPLGAIEQHGPRLPIDTDSYLASALALGGAEGRPVLVAPAIAYGCRSRPQSGGGEQFPGTLSLGGATFMSVVCDVLSGLLRHGFRRVLVFSWHMENHGFAYEAVHQATERHPGTVVVMEEPFDSLSEGAMVRLFPNGFPGWPLEHAGVLETSLMQFLRPSLVGDSEAPGDRLTKRAYDLLPEPPPDPHRTGVLWDASGSVAEIGKLAYDEIATKLKAVLDREFQDAK